MYFCHFLSFWGKCSRSVNNFRTNYGILEVLNGPPHTPTHPPTPIPGVAKVSCPGANKLKRNTCLMFFKVFYKNKSKESSMNHLKINTFLTLVDGWNKCWSLSPPLLPIPGVAKVSCQGTI